MSETINLSYHDGSFEGYVARPGDGAKAWPAVILIHEVWGLVDHIKDVSERLAREGYVVLAPDLLSHTGVLEKLSPQLLAERQNPETRDEAQKKMREAMAPIRSKEFGEDTVGRLKVCIEYLLADDAVRGEVAVMGFCFGGTYAYQMAIADERIKLALPFYGHAPEDLDELKGVCCPVYAFYGEDDARLMEQLPGIKQKMAEYGKTFEAKVYPGARHAFFNDSNPTTYDEEAAADAWKRSLALLKDHLSSQV